MASEGDADGLGLPDPPRLGGALREAAFDFYYNSWRFVPANVVWGILFIAIMLGGGLWLPALGLFALLAIPVVGLYRMGVLVARGAGTDLSDFFAGIRRFWRPALGAGVAATFLATVFTANVVIGLQFGGVFGWVFSALALYADIGLAMLLVAFWPLLVDPLREDIPLRTRLRLAVLVNLSRPGRMFVLTLVIGLILLASTFLFVALVTVSVAFVSLVATRYVLPAADRLEGRPTVHRAG